MSDQLLHDLLNASHPFGWIALVLFVSAFFWLVSVLTNSLRERIADWWMARTLARRLQDIEAERRRLHIPVRTPFDRQDADELLIAARYPRSVPRAAGPTQYRKGVQ